MSVTTSVAQKRRVTTSMLLLLALAGVLSLAACTSETPAPHATSASSAPSAMPAASVAPVNTAPVNAAPANTAAAASDLSYGEIVQMDTAKAKVGIKHGELRNLGMPAMTMLFRFKDSAWFKEYAVGDKIRFRAEMVNGTLTVTRIEHGQ